MPADNGIVAAIDVGTTKVCTIVGRNGGTKGVNILAHSTVSCNGLIKGIVSDVPATEKAIRESIRQVEQASGLKIGSAFVGVTGAHVRFENRREKLGSVSKGGVIVADELDQRGDATAGSATEAGRRLIHAVRMSYSVDGQAGIRNPMGMHSSDVEADTHLVTASASFIDRLILAVENSGIKVESLVLEPLASGLAVLSPGEKELGSVIVDMGGGTTDVVGFRHGRICYTGVIPVGGYQFTNDIAVAFNTPYEVAEEAKLCHGSTDPIPPSEDEEVSLPVKGRDTELKVRRRDISQLTRERAQELAALIDLKLDGVQLGEPSEVRLVLTGGASNLPGLETLMQRALSMRVRRGIPDVRGTIPEELRDPAYATAVGVLLWALNEYVPTSNESNSAGGLGVEAGRKGLLARLASLPRRLMPVGHFATKKGRV